MFKKFQFFIPILLLSSAMAAPPQEAPSPEVNKAVTPSARTCPNLNGFFVTGEFIYWKARIDSLEFAADVHTTQVDGQTHRSFRPIEVDHKFVPGFKIGVGGDLPFDGWDIYVNWTHFHTAPTVTKSTSQFAIFDLEDYASLPIFAGRRFKQSWNVMFNSIDFDWGRRFFLSETLSMRPSFGGKTAWIYQKIRATISDMQQTLTGEAVNPDIFRATIKNWGIGPYAALEGKWEIIWGLGLIGKASTALLWEDFDGESFQSSNEVQGQGTSENRVSLPFHVRRVRPTARLFIGLDWERCFIDNWLSVNLQLGYESQIFWSQIINVIEGTLESDFTLDGLTFMGRIDF